MFQLMTSVSVLVDDTAPATQTLCQALGIREPRPQWFLQGKGIRAQFLRVHPKYAVAPTFLELVSPGAADDSQPGGSVFPVAEIADRQGDRAVKIHATGIGMEYEYLKELAGHLQRAGIPHWYLGEGASARMVVGSDAPLSPYDWNADAGLYVEAIPSAELSLAEEGFTGLADIPSDLTPPDMVRILARQYLVEDLDETLRRLDTNLRWRAAEVTKEAGHRRAVMPFSAPRSARLELLQPAGLGPVADAYDRLGPGPWTVRVGVVDVNAKARDLAERGTPFTLEDGVLQPDPEATLQVPFEFVTAPRSAGANP